MVYQVRTSIFSEKNLFIGSFRKKQGFICFIVYLTQTLNTTIAVLDDDIWFGPTVSSVGKRGTQSPTPTHLNSAGARGQHPCCTRLGEWAQTNDEQSQHSYCD